MNLNLIELGSLIITLYLIYLLLRVAVNKSSVAKISSNPCQSQYQNTNNYIDNNFKARRGFAGTAGSYYCLSWLSGVIWSLWLALVESLVNVNGLPSLGD